MEGKFGLDTRHIPYVANVANVGGTYVLLTPRTWCNIFCENFFHQKQTWEKKKYFKVTGSIFGPNVGKLRETQTNVAKNSKMKRSKKRTFAMLMERPG